MFQVFDYSKNYSWEVFLTIPYSLLFGIREYSSIREYSWLFGIRYYSEFELRTPNTWKFEYSNLDNVDLDTVNLDTVDLDTVDLD